LDYNLQRFGPSDRRIFTDVQATDAIIGEMIDFFHRQSVQVLILSEYGITDVAKPLHLNRLFREQGWLAIKEELGLELLDYGASRVFAVADHQIAHVYLNDTSLEKPARTLLEQQAGVSQVLGRPEQMERGIGHRRSGDLIALASDTSWFTYYYWLDDQLAPDFARCVDIHRKPGYDPVELFLNPKLKFPKLKIARRLLQKKLGFRMLMDVVSLDALLVKGSHGLVPATKKDWPLLICENAPLLPDHPIEATNVYQVIRKQLLG
jgi:hypothetical protein